MNQSAAQLEPFMTMPRACVSCVHFTGIGFDFDEHCPFEADPYSRTQNRTPYGSCVVHRSEVFATEICNSYECDPLISPVPVRNRPVPRCAIQELLSLKVIDGDNSHGH